MGTVEDDDPVIQLLTDIALVVNDTESAVIPTKTIMEKLVGDEERPWATWRRDKPLTSRGLARLLGSLRIHPVHLENVRGYRRDAFSEAISRYLPSQASLRQEPRDDRPGLPDGCDSGGVAETAHVSQFPQ